MNPVFRLLSIAVVGFSVLTGAALVVSSEDGVSSLDQIAGGESVASGDGDSVKGTLPGRGAKIALGNNANAVLSLDLIADGAAGNRTDDGVTAGAVSGRGTKIALEVFAAGVTTTLRGVILRFDFDASLVSFVKAGNSAFALLLPEGSVGAALAATSPAKLASSGFLARAEFETVADVTGRAFSIGIESVTLAESSMSSDVLRTSSEISFNSAPSADFDGDGTVGFPDFLAFAGSFGSSRGGPRYEARFDLDGDGSVAFSDFLIFAGAFGSQVPPSGDGETVTFADVNLRAVIADSLGKAPDAPITRAEMATLKRIDAPNMGIRNLAGLEFATSLRVLYLGRVRAEEGGKWVNSNDISDLSPLSGLTNLAYLDLYRNSISDISDLSGLTGLTDLFLNENSISNLSALSTLTNLARLGLSQNGISDISALSDLTGLFYLDLFENSITNLSGLSTLTNLTWLFLDYNSISDISALSNLTKLTRLGLEHNSISNVSALSNLTDLVNLVLWHNSISDISALSNLTGIKYLYLNQNNISGISALSNLTNLEILGLEDNDILDVSPLVANTGLGTGDTVNLKSNPLSNASRNTHIPTLQRRGVTVEFDGGTSNLGACRAGLVVNPGETCTYKGNTFSVSSSGRGSIAFFSAGTGIDARGTTINGVRWNFHATKNSGSNSWTIHVAE
ncbi:MAG: hypothetical protein OXR72_09320 [Gemmatimonadota bacterium]|nr:hypothetical protein [Gemmatimonadota bacterium]